MPTRNPLDAVNSFALAPILIATKLQLKNLQPAAVALAALWMFNDLIVFHTLQYYAIVVSFISLQTLFINNRLQ